MAEPAKRERIRVFISANGRDFSSAAELKNKLAASKVEAFFCEADALQRADTSFTRQIYDALEDAEHFVFVASKPPVKGGAIASGWCKAEIYTFVNELNSERKTGNVCTVMLGGLQISDLPLALRQSLAFPWNNTGLLNLMQFLRTTQATPPRSQHKMPNHGTEEPSHLPTLPLAHPLHAYPLGPMVPRQMIPPGLPDYMARIYFESEISAAALDRANFMRHEADPTGEVERQCVPPEDVPNPRHAPPRFYWQSVLYMAGVKGPRMLVALIEDLDLQMMPEPLRTQVKNLLNALKKHDSQPEP